MRRLAPENPKPVRADRRKYPRTAIFGEIYFATKRRIYGGTLKDRSSRGLFIETAELFDLGELIFVALPSENVYDLKFKGRIVWRNQKGFGAKLESASK